MNILVVNCGSSSLKCRLYGADEQLLAKALVERIGTDIPDHAAALRQAVAGFDVDPGTIAGVGHRIVHGGERFSQSTLITPAVEQAIEDCCTLAPLHNPPNLLGLRAARALLPHAAQAGVFDTAFFHSLRPHAYLYAIPYEFYERDHIRRYGFHGTSHRYVSEQWAAQHGRTDGRLITVHLGNGCSVAAVEAGEAVDVSLGLTPLEGLVMGTRGGDIDPGAILHIMRRRGLDVAAMERLLNHESGLLGLSGISNDMRDLLRAEAEGNARARLALDVFCYRAMKYIGAFDAVLAGADAIIFTGGIGENEAEIRARIWPEDGRVCVIPTNEELLIARDTLRLLRA